MQDMTLDILSQVSGRDRWSLSRDFRTLYGTSPWRYVMMRRLDFCRQRMRAGERLVDIAAEAGFADQSHMTRQFISRFGLSRALAAGDPRLRRRRLHNRSSVTAARMLTAFITRRQPMYQLVNLAHKFSLFSEQWQPKVVAEMNDYQFKIVRIAGDFIWHSHPETDETLMVVEGVLRVDFRDGHVLVKAGR